MNVKVDYFVDGEVNIMAMIVYLFIVCNAKPCMRNRGAVICLPWTDVIALWRHPHVENSLSPIHLEADLSQSSHDHFYISSSHLDNFRIVKFWIRNHPNKKWTFVSQGFRSLLFHGFKNVLSFFFLAFLFFWRLQDFRCELGYNFPSNIYY